MSLVVVSRLLSREVNEDAVIEKKIEEPAFTMTAIVRYTRPCTALLGRLRMKHALSTSIGCCMQDELALAGPHPSPTIQALYLSTN